MNNNPLTLDQLKSPIPSKHDLQIMPEQLIKAIPSKFDIKASELMSKKDSKIEELTKAREYKTAMLESLVDADSPQFVGVTGSTGIGGDLTNIPTEDRIQGFDSYEVPHPGDKRNEEYLNSPSGKLKIERQKARLAQELNVPVSSVTMDDIYKAGTKEQLMALYNLTKDENTAEWTPGPLDWVNKDNSLHLGSKENPLNIPVERLDTGDVGYFGRPLTDVRNPNTKETVGDSLGYQSPNYVGLMETDTSRAYTPTNNRVLNPIKGAGSTVVGAAYGTADAISELAGYLTSGAVGGNIATTEEINTYANQLTGYDASYMENAGEEIKSAYRKFQKDGDWGDFLINAGTAGLSVAGEAGATSLAFVATLYLPGKPLQAASKLGKLIKAETVGMKAAEKATKTKELISNAKTVDKLIRIGQGQTGFIAVSMGETSADMDEYKKVYKEDMSPGRAMGSFGINLVKNNIDGFIDKGIITKSGIGSDTVRKLLMSGGDKEKVALAKELVARGFGVAADTLLKEIPTEIIQAGMENISAGYKEGEVGVSDVLTSQKTQEDMVVSAMMTPGSVGVMKAAGTAVSGAATVADKGLKAVDVAKLDSKREKAPVKSTVPTSTTKEEVRSKLVDINTKFDNKSYTTSKEVLDDVADLDTMVAGMQDEGITKSIDLQKQAIYSKIAEEGLGEVTLGSEAEATQMIEDIVLYSEPTDNQRATIDKIAERYGIDADKIIEVAKKGITEYERLGRILSRLNVDPIENEEKINKVISGLAAIEEANIYNQDTLTEAVAGIEANIKSGTQISGTEKVTLATGQQYDIEVKDGVINPEVYKTLEGIQRNLDGIRAQYKSVNLDEVGPTVQSVVDKIVSGEKEFTPAEQQIQINNKEKVELLLKEEVYKRSEAKKGSIKEQVENSWSSTIESVEGVPTKISNIVEVNSESKSKLSTQGIQSMSKTVSDYAKTAVDKLSKSILSVNPEVEKFKQKESPARGLMFDIDGKINENTATAIRLGLDELLAYGLDDLVPKTKADVARIMGLQEYEVKDAMLKEFQNLGLNKTILADKLGRSIAKNMGIKPNKEIDEELYARLIADLGQTAIIYGEDMGALQMQDISAARYAEIIGEDVKGRGNIGFVKPSNKYLNANRKAQRESVKRTRKRYDAIAKELSIEPDEIKTYRNEPLSPKKKYKARNNPIADVPQKVVKVLNKMRQIKHTKVESSVEWIKTNKELAMKLLGYKEDMSGHSKQVQDSQDAKNAAIEKSVEELLNAEGNKFYFDWFYSKNGRYMVDSVTINPQSDKLHRFIIVPDSHNVELDSNDVDHMNKLRYALAQAVGFAVDKKSTKEILAKGQAVLDAGSVKLEKYLHSSKADIEHLGHYLQAVEAVKNYENRSKDGKFSTNITAEFDALTSGFGIKLMQFPILKDMTKWLEKVGVYTNKSMKSMNDELSSKGFTDSYQTLASQIKRGAIQPEYDNYKLWNELSAVLPEAVKGEAVTSELRGLFKNPFMTFNYAAGMNSIKKSLSENIVDEIVEGLATGNKKYARLEYVLKRYVPNLRIELQTKELSDIKIGNSNLHKELTTLVNNTYGEQVQKIMETEFSEFVEANKVINDSFKAMFAEYKKAYDKAIKEVKDIGKPITSQKKIEIIRSLRDKFPMIKGPLSETREEGVAIHSTGKQDIDKKIYAKTQWMQKREGEKDRKLTQPMIRPLIREFEEAMSAGAVIPIHFIDGAVMNKVAEMFEAQYIHDAIMPNLLDMNNAVKEYNKAWYETNRDYSIIDELVDAMDNPSEGLLELQKRVQEGRKWLYDQNAEIGHMVGMEDGVYRKAKAEVEYNDEQIKIIKEFMSKPRIAKLLKDNDITIEEC